MIRCRKRYLVTQINLELEGKHEAYYWVEIPRNGEPDYYRQTTSFQSFFYNEKNVKKKKGNYCHPKLVFTCIHMDDVADDYMVKGVPTAEYRTIWPFYKQIGYDYQTQKAVHKPMPLTVA